MKNDEQSKYESELLSRLRVKMTNLKDDLDITSWAIRSLEKTLEQKPEEKDENA